MNYEQKYKEVLEGIQEILSSGQDTIRMSRLQLRLQGIFPELKESEDERIRKALLEMVHDTEWDDSMFHDYSLDKNKTIAWLEKQGESPILYDSSNIGKDFTDYINELSKQFPEVSFAKLSRIAVRIKKWLEKQGEKEGVDDSKNSVIEDLINYFKYNKGLVHEIEEVVTWLEKQGKQSAS